jgi:hypothetical protein
MSNSLKSYAPTGEGALLLACRKCQKKLKGERGTRALAKLKKAIKRLNKNIWRRAIFSGVFTCGGTHITQIDLHAQALCV